MHPVAPRPIRMTPVARKGFPSRGSGHQFGRHDRLPTVKAGKPLHGAWGPPDRLGAELLIVANMRMVVAQAHHHCRVEGDLRDMVQEGNRGLLRALETYEPTRGLKFCTYAVWWIRAYMLKFTMDNWRLV